MRDVDYAYAVGRIRVNELSLLTSSDIDQMLSAPDRTSVLRILSDKGWNTDTSDIAQAQLEDTWRLITECTPSPELLEAMIIGNDFANLKAGIKAVFSHNTPENYYITPCVCDTGLITKAVNDGDFTILPDYLSQTGAQAYDCAARLSSGMLAEICIDRASLETRFQYSKKSGSALLERIILLQCAAADIKIALRCNTTGKDRAFAEAAMCLCPDINISALLDASGSTESIAEYLEATPFSPLADSLREGFTAFERECDSRRYALLEDAKWEAFGPDPIVAYYYAKVNEARNVRIILSAKESGLNIEQIKKRVSGYHV